MGVDEVTFDTVGAIPSTTIDAFAPRELAAPGVGRVSDAGLEALSIIEPPLRTRDEVAK